MAELDGHTWLDAESLAAGEFRFCLRCGREEWSTGTVIPGVNECAPFGLTRELEES